ncbi:MAG: TonB-dependent receptor [Opitutae bacterium]|nr:TonB-dependent receptor [Opitutae bacterium]
MHKSLFKSLLLAALAAVAVMFAPHSFAQVVTAGMTGTVRGTDGKAVSGATVTAVHTPTNASFRAVTNAEGRFNFRGLPVGGPYTVTTQADGYAPGTQGDITTELGNDIALDVTLNSDVVKLEQFVVSADKNALDASATGAGSVLSNQRLSTKPSSERSLADMISASPLVTLRSTFGDREESQLTAVGQNNRYNSIQIDGARINDQFGLNGTGLASFFNPLSLDTIEQLSVQISPYDVRLAGFTGASINAVTKSGTNQFHGSAYYYFRGDHLSGQYLQGPNRREQTLTGAKVTPKLDRSTWGATLGGPIIRDRLFFFLNYEKFESTSAGRDPRFSTPLESAILARYQQYATAAGKTINWGNPVTGATTNAANDKKIIGKIDWNITNDHRLSVRYSKTDGLVPQFGNFAGSSSSNAGINGGVSTSSDGHFYEQTRIEKSYAAQLFSQWTPDFKTELKYSSTTQDQLTPVHTIAPMTYVFGVSGTDLLNNTSVTNGAYIVGTERFRQGNVINVDTKQMSAVGDYFWKKFVFTFGAEREQSDFYNLFREGSYGLVAFPTYNDFLNDTNVRITRNYYDPAVRNVADISKFATTGVFGQVKWDVNSRLTVNGGVRYEFAESGLRPPLNQAFLTATGFRNDGSLDGVTTFSPRVGFNYTLDDERTTQLRGGVGHFLGRAPWVFFSNSFGNTGVGTFSRSSTDSVSPLPNSFTAYLKDHFDPTNPVGTGVDNPSLRRAVNWNDDGLKLPSAWRANLALDHKLAFLSSTISFEYVYSKIDAALRTTDENLRPTTLGADGRQRFAGNPTTQANARYSAFTNLYRVSNTDVGQSTYISLSWDRPMKNKWGFNLAYTRGRSTEAQSNGQTTAGGQFNRNVVFNQNTVEVGTADFEIKDRIQLSLTREFEVIKKWKTTASLYYEGRSGNPYSWVFGGDLNSDGVQFNDAVAVPSGIDDARFDFSGMTSAQRDSFFAFIQSSGLSKYAGGIAPKNSFIEPWVNRLDLKLVQDIPLGTMGSFKPKVQLFFDFINFGSFISKDMFGYTEIAPFLSNDVFRTRTLTNATTYGTDGRIKPTFTSQPSGFGIDNGMSRWRIQLGAKVLF